MKKTGILLFIAASALSFAQSIQGKISGRSNAGLADAEIVATKGEKKFSSVADDQGKFSMQLPENGSYLLEVFHDGEKMYSSEVDVLGEINRDILVKTPAITEQKVEGIVLSGRKKLVERKVDRLVFNVENSVASQGIDGIEALAKTPMVRATDTGISIAGKSNVAVMVNDRLLNLSGEELISYLKTLRSDDIQKIEVITTPPARYEAEGKSGLINIILKKNTSLGWNGSVQASGGYYWGRTTVSPRQGASLNYQGEKLSVSANASVNNNFWEMDYFTHNTGQNSFWNTDSQAHNNFRYQGGNVKTEYKINDKNLMGFSYNYGHSNVRENSDNSTKIKDESGYREFLSTVRNHNRRNVHNATVFYDVKLDSLGSKLNISANLMDNRSNANNYYNTITSSVSSTYINPINRYRIYAGQADFEKNFAKVKGEAGLKYTKIDNRSDFNFFDILNGDPVPNMARSNSFIYNEQNFAAYVSASYKISEKWDAKLGLRYEYTTLKGVSPQEDLTSEKEYGKFFPTAYLSYKPGENHSFSLNYSRRINRPYFGALNSFRYYTSDFEYNTGNPYLLPSFTDNLEMSYVLKSNFTTTLYYNHNKNNFDRIQRIENGYKYSINMNFYDEDQTGISLNYNFNKLKWLESNIFATAYYSKSKSFIPDTVAELDGSGANFNMDNTFFLNKDKTFSLILGLWGDLPNRNGNTHYETNYSVYTGMKLSFLEKNLLINVYMNDILNTNISKGTEYYKDFNSSYSYKGITRNAYLSVTYKFGNNNVKGATKQVKFDEQNRAN